MENLEIELSEVKYDFLNEFELASKGNIEKASFLILKPPTMQHHPLAAPLKQSISRIVSASVEEAQSKATTTEPRKTDDETDEVEDEAEDEITSQMVLNSIYTSKNVHANTVWEQAKKLLVNDTAFINGKQKLSTSLINKMSIKDFEGIVGLYIASFILV